MPLLTVSLAAALPGASARRTYSSRPWRGGADMRTRGGDPAPRQRGGDGRDAVRAGGDVAAVRMWRPVPAQWLGMSTLVALLFC